MSDDAKTGDKRRLDTAIEEYGQCRKRLRVELNRPRFVSNVRNTNLHGWKKCLSSQRGWADQQNRKMDANAFQAGQQMTTMLCNAIAANDIALVQTLMSHNILDEIKPISKSENFFQQIWSTILAHGNTECLELIYAVFPQPQPDFAYGTSFERPYGSPRSDGSASSPDYDSEMTDVPDLLCPSPPPTPRPPSRGSSCQQHLPPPDSVEDTRVPPRYRFDLRAFDRKFVGDPFGVLNWFSDKWKLDLNADECKLLRKCSEDGWVDAVTYLVDSHKSPVTISNNMPIRMAAKNGHHKIVKFLHEQGANVHVYKEEALRSACRYGHFEVAEYLVNAGCDVTANRHKALLFAATNGHKEITELLLNEGSRLENLAEACMKKDEGRALEPILFYGIFFAEQHPLVWSTIWGRVLRNQFVIPDDVLGQFSLVTRAVITNSLMGLFRRQDLIVDACRHLPAEVCRVIAVYEMGLSCVIE